MTGAESKVKPGAGKSKDGEGGSRAAADEKMKGCRRV